MIEIENYDEQLASIDNLPEDEKRIVLIEQLLAYLIKNPQEYVKFSFIDKILLNEDYVIYFYITNSIKNGIQLNYDILKISLEQNVSKWLNKKSILNKNTKSNMDKDYIQSKVVESLVTPNDYKEAFIQIVLDRYKKLSKINVEIDFSSEYLKSILTGFIESELGVELMYEVVDLMKQDKFYKGENYNQKTIIPYLRKRLTELGLELSDTTKFDDYRSYITERYSNRIQKFSKCFDWNLGKKIYLPEIDRGFMVSIIGQEKVGKTKFVTGEMVYPTLISGKNVLIYTSEMEETELMEGLVSKYIYDKGGFKISPKDVGTCVGVEAALDKLEVTLDEYLVQEELYEKLLRGEITPENYEHNIEEDIFNTLYEMRTTIKDYTKITKSKREIILMYFYDMITNPKMGRAYVLEYEDDVFNIDTMIAKSNSLIDKYNAVMVVYDHAGFAYSESGIGKTEVMTRVYQYAKNIAKRRKNPVAFVVINHIATDISESIGKNSGVKGGTIIRAHQTSEAKKSADVEIALYRTAELEKEGAINIQVLASRHEDANKDPRPFIVDYVVSDFTALGSSKDKYQ